MDLNIYELLFRKLQQLNYWVYYTSAAVQLEPKMD